MRPELANGLLRGVADGCAYGMSWVPVSALQARLPRGTGKVDAIVLTAQELEADFMFVDARDPWSLELVPRLESQGTAAFWAVPGVFGRVAEQSGWVETLRSSVIEPGALAFPLSEAVHSAAEQVRAGLAAGASVFVIADDLASTAGWLVPPDYALEALVPCYEALAADVLAAGCRVLFHSDGDVRAVYGRLARGGFSAVHLASLERSALDAAVTAARTAGLVPCGGVTARSPGSDETSGAIARMAAFGESGPVLICDDGGMTTPVEIGHYIEAMARHRSGSAA